VTVRNIRYYQSLGLVDRPLSADGRGFAEKHRLQLIAIRLLQAKGLPLARIQSLVSGRNEEELREVESRGVSELEAAPAFPQPVRAAEWKVTPITGEILVLARFALELTPAQRLKIQEILSPEPEPSGSGESNGGTGLDSFRPETD
jgi:DNA-binding transcriptional MerR regulator